MSSDASAAAASPMTNGVPQSGSHREADASTGTIIIPTPPPLPAATNHSLLEVCADLHDRLISFLNAPSEDSITRRTQEQTRVAYQVIEKALQDYDFDELSLSYNGGKDCLVLLIIYLAVLHTHFTQPHGRRKDAPTPQLLPSIYAKPPDPFPSVTSFVEWSSQEYYLDLVHISTNPGIHPNPAKAKSHSSPPLTSTSHGNSVRTPSASEIHSLEDPTSQLQLQQHQTNAEPSTQPTIAHQKVVTFRDAFAHYLETHPQVRAIFVGTRRTDPHGGHLTHFDMTDGNWPRFMRVHPVIDWHLDEIWAFLRSPHLADRKRGEQVLRYCDMYDQGYTSLGGVGDTLRNPKLGVLDPKTGEVVGYRPAYALTDDGEERLGRE